MKIFVFGNPIVVNDSLPMKFLPKLKKSFPYIDFVISDPTESWTHDEKSIIIIDTVIGIGKVTVYNSLDAFQKQPMTTPHDYGLYTDLKLLAKLGIIENITIVGVPPKGKYRQLENAVAKVVKIRKKG